MHMVGSMLLGRDIYSVFQLQWREIFRVKSEIEDAIARAEYGECYVLQPKAHLATQAHVKTK